MDTKPQIVDISDEIKEKIDKTLRYSIIDGAFYCVMVGLGESFFSAFAVFLHATKIQIGLLGTLPIVLGSLVQLLSRKMLQYFHSRKRFVCIFAFLQGALYFPIALTFFLGSYKATYLLILVCIYFIFGMVLGPAWNSWMGDLVEEKSRGKYFGKRTSLMGMASFVSMLLGGYVLHFFQDTLSLPYFGFFTLFTLAFFARSLSFYYLMKKYEPEYKPSNEASTCLLEFLKHLKKDNYSFFVAFLCCMNFSVYVSVPFFVPYMLQDLKLSYLELTIVNVAPVIVKIVMIPQWGAACDRFGTLKILSCSAFLVPTAPLLWVFCGEVWYLVLIQVYIGFVWAGFEISSFNFMFEATAPSQRITCIAYYNMFNGIAILLGGLAGSLLVKYNHVFWSPFILVFLLSSALRLFACVCWLPRLKEVRLVEQISYRKLVLKIVTTMPNMGIVHHLIAFRKKTFVDNDRRKVS